MTSRGRGQILRNDFAGQKTVAFGELRISSGREIGYAISRAAERGNPSGVAGEVEYRSGFEKCDCRHMYFSFSLSRAELPLT